MSNNPSADANKPDVEPIDRHDVRAKREWMRFKRADELTQVTLVRAILGFVRTLDGPDGHRTLFDVTNRDRDAIKRGVVRGKRDERAIKAPLVLDKARLMLART